MHWGRHKLVINQSVTSYLCYPDHASLWYEAYGLTFVQLRLRTRAPTAVLQSSTADDRPTHGPLTTRVQCTLSTALRMTEAERWAGDTPLHVD